MIPTKSTTGPTLNLEKAVLFQSRNRETYDSNSTGILTADLPHI